MRAGGGTPFERQMDLEVAPHIQLTYAWPLGILNKASLGVMRLCLCV